MKTITYIAHPCDKGGTWWSMISSQPPSIESELGDNPLQLRRGEDIELEIGTFLIDKEEL